MSKTLVDRAVGRFGNRLDRRSMIRRTTLAATALVAAPTDFVLRPKSAYAAVCRCQGQGCPCGSRCCDGYTEFCCTLTGENGCPPGTVAAGWWKVDGSRFCGGAPRYYLDCNAQCGGCGCKGGLCNGSCSGTACGCAYGDCNNWKAGCVKFRYGQCNQQFACLGPIVCRVVTCTPPWVFDESCTTTSRTDNNTANHHRPCLDAPFGAFDGITDVGGAVRAVGWAIDQNLRDGVEVRLFIDQRPMASTMADIDRADVGAAYPYYGSRHGFDITIDCDPGRHVICVLAVDQGSGAIKFLAFRSFEVAPSSGSIEGYTASPGQLVLNGWAVNGAAPGTNAIVRLVVDGTIVADTATSISRPDVVAVDPRFGPTTGFSLVGSVAAGPHQACLEVVYPTGRTGKLGCIDVVVP